MLLLMPFYDILSFFLYLCKNNFHLIKNVKMKKLIISVVFLLVVAISGYTAYRNYQSSEANLFDVCLSDCEALLVAKSIILTRNLL